MWSALPEELKKTKNEILNSAWPTIGYKTVLYFNRNSFYYMPTIGETNWQKLFFCGWNRTSNLRKTSWATMIDLPNNI